MRSWNPLWANAEVYWSTLVDAARARRWRDRLQIWVRRPGWRPADVAARHPKPGFDLRRATYDPPMSGAMRAYAGLQFLLLLGMSLQFLMGQQHMPTTLLLGYFLYMALSLTLLGWVMEGRRLAVPVETLRLLASAAAVGVLGRWFGAPLSVPLQAGLLGAAAIGLVLLWAGRRSPVASPGRTA